MFSRIPVSASLLCLVILVQSCTKHNDTPAAPPPNDLVETTPPFQKGHTIFINNYISGYYDALPAHYSVTTKKYPVIIYLHGGGQVGDGDKDLPLVLNDGVAKEIAAQKFPANVVVNGENFSFIVLSPQMRATPPDSMVWNFIQFALQHYRIDESRIYISGLSMGGVLTTELGGKYTSKLAAISPMAGESFGDDKTVNAQHIAQGNLPMWDFHNSDDPSIPASTAVDFVNLVNSFSPGTPPRLTIFKAVGHDAWTAALDPNYRENNKNLYEWMLQYKR
jgi:predicted peptidase